MEQTQVGLESNKRWIDKIEKLLLFILILFSVFQGLSIYNVNIVGINKGISPYWIFATIFICFVFIENFGKIKEIFFTKDRNFNIIIMSLTLFVLYAIVSAFVLPFIFQGIYVLVPNKGIDQQYLNPSILKWSFSNFAQSVYILINFLVVLSFIYYFSKTQVILFVKAYIFIGLLIILIAIFQHISVFYFPNILWQWLYAVTHNNPEISMYPAKYERVFSTFTEPSFFSCFIASYTIFIISLYLITSQKKFLFISALSFYSLLLALSTTGYFSMLIGFLATTFTFLAFSKLPTIVKIKRISKIVAVLLLIFGFMTIAEQTVTKELHKQTVMKELRKQTVMKELYKQTVTKFETLSFKHRIWADYFSITNVFPNTAFLGAGLGSNRPSSFLAYIISNMGIIGILSFLFFLFKVYQFFFRNREEIINNGYYFATFSVFTTYLAGMFAAVPDPNFPPFLWIYTGMVLSVIYVLGQRRYENNLH